MQSIYSGQYAGLLSRGRDLEQQLQRQREEQAKVDEAQRLQAKLASVNQQRQQGILAQQPQGETPRMAVLPKESAVSTLSKGGLADYAKWAQLGEIDKAEEILNSNGPIVAERSTMYDPKTGSLSYIDATSNRRINLPAEDVMRLTGSGVRALSDEEKNLKKAQADYWKKKTETLGQPKPPTPKELEDFANAQNRVSKAEQNIANLALEARNEFKLDKAGKRHPKDQIELDRDRMALVNAKKDLEVYRKILEESPLYKKPTIPEVSRQAVQTAQAPAGSLKAAEQAYIDAGIRKADNLGVYRRAYEAAKKATEAQPQQAAPESKAGQSAPATLEKSRGAPGMGLIRTSSGRLVTVTPSKGVSEVGQYSEAESKPAQTLYEMESSAKKQEQPKHQSFATEEEAMKAGLPKGAIVMINGRRARID
jgi:hypothetical protein